MKYLVLFEDNDEFAHMREKHMQAHLQFMADNDASFDAAGPLRDAHGSVPAGGVWIIDAADATAARALVEADPFYNTELRKSVRILEWTQTYADGKKIALNPALARSDSVPLLGRCRRGREISERSGHLAENFLATPHVVT